MYLMMQTSQSAVQKLDQAHTLKRSLTMALGLIERLKVVETKTIKWTLTVAFEDHSPPPSLPIMSGGG